MRKTITKEVLTIMRIVRAMESRFGADLVECTSGQSEDYLSHWGVYILNTVFVLLWSNGLCELRSMVCASCAAWSVRVAQHGLCAVIAKVRKHVQSASVSGSISISQHCAVPQQACDR